MIRGGRSPDAPARPVSNQARTSSGERFLFGERTTGSLCFSRRVQRDPVPLERSGALRREFSDHESCATRSLGRRTFERRLSLRSKARRLAEGRGGAFHFRDGEGIGESGNRYEPSVTSEWRFLFTQTPSGENGRCVQRLPAMTTALPARQAPYSITRRANGPHLRVWRAICAPFFSFIIIFPPLRGVRDARSFRSRAAED